MKSNKQIWLKKWQSLLLLLLFSILFMVLLMALVVHSTMEETLEKTEKTIGTRVTLTAKKEAAISKIFSTNRPAWLTLNDLTGNLVAIEDATTLAKSKAVGSYSLKAAAGANAVDDIKPISETKTSTSSQSFLDQLILGLSGAASGDFQLTGVSATSSLNNFSSGSAKIIHGTGITAADAGSNKVVIESSLAKDNGLKVGDFFTIKGTQNSTSYTVSVKGIYKAGESAFGFNLTDPGNVMYCHYTLANQVNQGDAKHVDSVVYSLKSPDEVGAFVKKGEAEVGTARYQLRTNQKLYKLLKEALGSVLQLSRIVIICGLLIGVVILLVVIGLKRRKQQTGFVEIVIPLLMAFGIVLAFGNRTADWIEKEYLSQQNINFTEESEMPEEYQAAISESFEGLSTEETLAEMDNLMQLFQFDLQVGTLNVLRLGGLGMVILVFATGASSAFVFWRKSDKKIAK